MAALVVATFAASARGEDKAGQALERFQRAMEAFDRGRYEEACPLFEESLTIDRKKGTLFSLALCEERRGRFATAARRYREYLDAIEDPYGDRSEKDKAREPIAKQSLSLCERRAGRIVVDGSPRPSRVTVDGRDIDVPKDVPVVLVDPGARAVVVEEGRDAPYKTTLDVAPGQTVRLKVPAVGEAGGPGPGPKPSKEDEAPRDGTPQRVAAWFIGITGVVGVAMGSAAGIAAIVYKVRVDDDCIDSRCRTQDGLDAADSGTTAATVSTVGFGAGLALVAGALVLYFTAPEGDGSDAEAPPRKASVAPWIAPRAGGATFGVGGTW